MWKKLVLMRGVGLRVRRMSSAMGSSPSVSTSVAIGQPFYLTHPHLLQQHECNISLLFQTNSLYLFLILFLKFSNSRDAKE